MASNLTTATNFLSLQPVSPPPSKPASERTFSFPDHLLQQTSQPSEAKSEKPQPAKKPEKKSSADSSKKSDATTKAGRKLTGKPIVREGDVADPGANAPEPNAAAPQIDPATLLTADGEIPPEPTADAKPAKPGVADASAGSTGDAGAAGALVAALTGGTTPAPPQAAADAPSPNRESTALSPESWASWRQGSFIPAIPRRRQARGLPPDSTPAADPGNAAAVNPGSVGAKPAGKQNVALLADDPAPLAPATANKPAPAPPVPADAAPAPTATLDPAAVPPADAPPAKSTDGSATDAAAALAAKPAIASAPHSAATAPPQASTPAPEARFAEANHASIVSSVHTQLLPHGGTMQIRLDPPELGALQVVVEMRNGSMSATFQTSNDDATRLLSHSLGQLETALEAQGVTVDKIQVQQSPRDQHAPGGDDRQQQGSLQDQQQARQDQQRKEMLQRMWRKLSLGSDPIDMVA